MSTFNKTVTSNNAATGVATRNAGTWHRTLAGGGNAATCAAIVAHVRNKVLTVNCGASIVAVGSVSKTSFVGASCSASCNVIRGGMTLNRTVVSNAGAASGVEVREKYADVYFAWPAYSPYLQLSLRSPEFGNIQTLNTQIQAKRSRSGELYLFKRTPVYEQMKLEFAKVDEVTFTKIISFIKQTAGTLVTYVDHKNQRWQGYILTDPIELINDHRGPNRVADPTTQPIESDWYHVSLQFEGNIV